MRRLIASLLLLCAVVTSHAGVMTREQLAQHFPSPLIIGDKDPELPVWPVLKQEMTSTELVGYVFESIDFVQLPGFSGVPINLLVALDPKGGFLDVRVIEWAGRLDTIAYEVVCGFGPRLPRQPA